MLNLNKKKSYIINLKFGNFKNKLYYFMNTTTLNNITYLSNYLYININNT